MSWELELGFIPASQKNQYERSRKFKKSGGATRSLRLSDRFTAQREKLEWLLKRLDRAAWDRRFSLYLTIYPKSKRMHLNLVLEEHPVDKIHGVADPDGILTTLLDSLRRSGRVADDSINHIAHLSVTVIPAD